MDGHMCLFVEGCKNHYDGQKNESHEKNLNFLEDKHKEAKRI